MKPWTITYDGLTFTDADLTNGDAVACLVLVEDGWNSANVWKSPLHANAVTAVLLARATGAGLDEVVAKVNAAPFGSIIPEPRDVT